MRRVVVVLCVAALAFALCDDDDARPPRLATWNIRDYPESTKQEDAVFAEVAALGVDVLALQEITDPARLRDQARQRLGGQWRSEFSSDSKAIHQVGLLFNDDVVDLGWTREHPEVALYAGARPALEVGLFFDDPERELPRVLDVIVVHLKAGRDHAPMRARQLAALRPIVERARAKGYVVVVAGDFNAGTAADRAALADFGVVTDVAWRSAELGCTGLWPQQGDRCSGGALDHVFACVDVDVRVAGPCADGCDFDDGCPVFSRDVSDHCPVVVDLAGIEVTRSR